MKKKGHLKKKLRRKLEAKVGPVHPGDRTVIVCVGDKCAAREENRATLAEASAHAARAATGGAGHVRVACTGCLKVCKKGPIVAVLPEANLYRRVGTRDVDALIDDLALGAAPRDDDRARAGDLEEDLEPGQWSAGKDPPHVRWAHRRIVAA
jgi:(2Fe-2S) ferredoxin